MRRTASIVPHTVTLVGGVVLSFLVFAAVCHIEGSATKARFRQGAENRVSALRWGIADKLIELQAVAALFASAKTVDRNDLAEFATPFVEDETGIRALQWIQRVSDVQREQFELDVRGEGFIDFQITELGADGGVLRAEGRREYFPVTLIEPFPEGAGEMGFDLASDSACRERMLHAAATGEMVVSPKASFRRGADDASLLRVLVPVYPPGAVVNSIVDRRERLSGFVAGVFSVGEIVDSALSYLGAEGVDVAVYDVTDPRRTDPLHWHEDHRPGRDPNTRFPTRLELLELPLHQASRVEFAGRTWSVVCFPTAAFVRAEAEWRPWAALIVGLLFTGLFASYLKINMTRTLDLSSANTRLEKEIAERKAVEARLRYDSCHDVLTDLPNRAALMERLGRCVQRSKRLPKSLFAVLFLDIDNFKLVNDSLGHSAGDKMLVEIAHRLETCLRSLDTVAYVREEATARLGGDEFVILLDRIQVGSDVMFVAERIHEQLAKPFELEGHKVVVTASIGIAVSDGRYDDAEDVLRDADTAMYRAKAAGKARHALFDETMHAEAMTRLQIEQDLVRAVEDSQFFLVYQPIVALDSGAVAGFEALLRWQHPRRGVVMPREFMPVLVELGLIGPLGKWILTEACHRLSALQRRLPRGRNEFISVNIARRQLEEPGFADSVRTIVGGSGVSADRLRFEIAENGLIGDSEGILRTLKELRKLGIRLHMDNFGTGNSSISCLHQMPLDCVDIDGAFINTMGANRQYSVIARAVVDLAHNLNMKVLAEGIETEEQLAAVLALDCDYAQGDHFHKPMDGDAIARLLTAQVPWLKPA